MDPGLRPIVKDIEQDTLDIAKVFKLLSSVDVGKLKAIDVYFTEQGVGYLNAMASLNPNLFVVKEDIYLELKEKYEELIEKYGLLKNDNSKLLIHLSEDAEDIRKLEKTADVEKNHLIFWQESNSKYIDKNRVLICENVKLKATIDTLREPKWWEFWK